MASKPIKKYLLFYFFFFDTALFCSILVTTLRSCNKVCYFFTIRRVHSLSGAANGIVIRLRGKHLEA
ncbi:unnamed protein product [Acanthoscelides obtectus]|uniref:Uncharacterized protein n=1 Tax=Acanthoscelides obtectus TaxID=200917 RepID=A0A9P0PF84_ACAOB|nr:unnamed protein product [Acanthoscelides obtectus]CAK1635859.1 hypothetical protein AOBTE_LOCUS9569 [Acanthoscelides obtectus]